MKNNNLMHCWPLLCLLGQTSLAQSDAQIMPMTPAVDWGVMQEFCLGCHNFDDQAGGLALDILAPASMLEDAEAWEKSIRKLRTGLMPPRGQPRPGREVLDSFAAQLEGSLDHLHQLGPDPGIEGISRLNRAEYINAVRDLLSYDAEALALTLLPMDDSEAGFDNMAEALTISPTLIDSYVTTAMRISREAVGDRTMVPGQIRLENPGSPATRHVEGLPLGTRGGMLLSHYFPLDAQYEFRIAANTFGGLGGPGLCGVPDVVVTFDGQPLQVDNYRSFRLPVTAGHHSIGVALLDQHRCEGVLELYDDFSMAGNVQHLEVHGPFEPTGTGDTPSRRAIFTCYPDNSDAETGCARQILTGLAAKAFRRSQPDDTAVDTLLHFYHMGQAEGNFETGIQYALSRLLIDPRFLYRLEEEPVGLSPGEVYRISDLDLASRLAFFLWSSIPDEALLNLAASGTLSDPQVLAAETRRMLADPKADALVDNFAAQWLKLRQLDAALPQDNAFSGSLRRAFRQETELLFRDMVAQDHGVLHLLDADYTWLNQQLAAHYGIEGVRGDYMRRVNLPANSPRRGVLGHGSILTATSVADRTSPVIRGEWIMANMLGAPVPVPPPGVEADLSNDTIPAGRPLPRTLRERLEMHLEDPTCAACHQIMDPIGFALENFDLIGRWRDTENGHPLDTGAALVDGTPINGPADLRQALLGRPEAVVTSMTEKLMAYALGRPLAANDMPAVRRVVSQAGEDDYRFSKVIQGIVESLPFQYKRVPEASQIGLRP
jgi:hypothetical protein